MIVQLGTYQSQFTEPNYDGNHIWRFGVSEMDVNTKTCNSSELVEEEQNVSLTVLDTNWVQFSKPNFEQSNASKKAIFSSTPSPQ